MALILCTMLVLASVSPAAGLATEADSEGEGTAPPVDLPFVPPDFDPGGEETGLDEVPASGGGGVEDEGGAVETEPEIDLADPPVEEVPTAPVESPSAEAVPAPAPPAPEPPPALPETTGAAQDPVVNEPITAPEVEPVPAQTSATTQPPATAAPEPTEPADQEAPPSTPAPIPATAADSTRNLAGATYVVRRGDCLWHIAADLLPAGSSTSAIESEVERLWRLNEDQIGTGDPSLIYAGTTLRLR